MLFSLPLNVGCYTEHFLQSGFAIVPNVLKHDTVESLQTAMAEIPSGEEVRKKRNIYGVRNLLEISPIIRQLAASAAIHRFVSPILGERAFAARAVFLIRFPMRIGRWATIRTA